MQVVTDLYTDDQQPDDIKCVCTTVNLTVECYGSTSSRFQSRATREGRQRRLKWTKPTGVQLALFVLLDHGWNSIAKLKGHPVFRGLRINDLVKNITN